MFAPINSIVSAGNHRVGIIALEDTMVKMEVIKSIKSNGLLDLP